MSHFCCVHVVNKHPSQNFTEQKYCNSSLHTCDFVYIPKKFDIALG